MTEQQTFFKQLMRRRVPQIVGTYIAGLWLVVEIGGWVTEQLALPSAYALYLFIGLVALLPSVILLAWRHGAPGPDLWGRAETLVVPINVLMAVGAVVLVAQVRPPVAAVDTVAARPAVVERTVVDEEGQAQVYQVAREGYGVSVLTLFWPRAGEPVSETSWESYAVPWLVSVDFAQDPLITGGVAFDRSVIEELAAAGYPDGVGEPLSLALSIAAERAMDFLVRGEYTAGPEGYLLSAEVYSVQDGALVETLQAQGPTLIAAADVLGSDLGEVLVRGLDRGDAAFRPLNLQERTTTETGVIEPFIRGLRAMLFDSDFDQAVAFLETALELDPTFAPGWAWLHQMHRTRGDMAAASAAIEQALAHDHKLDTETQFALRANQYAVAGDMDRTIRVLRMWTEVQPYNLRAWMTLTTNLLLVGEVDEAREANIKAQELDPDRASLDRARAQIEEAAGNFELAAEVLSDYLDAEPQDDAAWISLGDVRHRAGDIEDARDAYERAGFVASNPFTSRARLLWLEARSGDAEAAIAGYRRALQGNLQPSEKFALIQQFIYELDNLGRAAEGLALIENHSATFTQALPPVVRTLTFEGLRTGLLTSLGRYDQALEVLERAQTEVGVPFGVLLEQARIPIFEETGDLLAAQTSLENLRQLIESFEMPGQRAQFDMVAARVLAMQGDYPGALQKLDGAQAELQGTSLGLISQLRDPLVAQMAEYRLENGEPEQALQILDRQLLSYANSGGARLLRARTLHALGREEEARAALSELLDFYASADPEYQLMVEAQDLAEQWGM
ncbi:MAG: tetratricopeptide repeat protein [Wenzhouxiangella sp.]|jgi:tetratricopeptide (TPR) repeat protein|nr:tetratricopeptide repeat protein [Wenzhouxiangella sp.]